MIKTVYDIAAGAMSLNRLRINTIASNLANANTSGYQRRDVVASATDLNDSSFTSYLDEASLKGVKVGAVVVDNREPMMVHDPSHPNANPATGMVEMPNISPVTEMVNMVSASTAYKAAAEIISTAKEMAAVIKGLANRI